jgi:hypothetical protein
LENYGKHVVVKRGWKSTEENNMKETGMMMFYDTGMYQCTEAT